MPKPEPQYIRYHAFHPSYILVAGFVVVIGAILAAMAFSGVQPLHLVLFFVAFAVLGCGYGVTVIVDRDALYVSYGIGIISFSMDLASIESCGIVSNQGLTTFFYSPRNQYALEARFRQGGRMRIPADDPKALASVIATRL